MLDILQSRPFIYCAMNHTIITAEISPMHTYPKTTREKNNRALHNSMVKKEYVTLQRFIPTLMLTQYLKMQKQWTPTIHGGYEAGLPANVKNPCIIEAH